MVKLSQQLAIQEGRDGSVLTERVSRTERVGEKQSREKIVEKIQKEEFKDKTVTETFTVEIPSVYNQNQGARVKWFGFSNEGRSQILAQAKARGQQIDKITKKRSRKIPFTFEEGENSYRQVYERLSPNAKQFFKDPETVLESKAERIETTKKTIQDKFIFANQKIASAKIKYDKKRKANQDYYNRLGGASRERYAATFKRNEDKYEDDYEEDLEKWRGFKQGLNEGVSELNKNKDLSFSDIEKHAFQVADFFEQREDARNEQRKFDQKKRVEIKNLQEQGYKPFIVEKSFKGKTEEAYLEFLKDGDWKRVATFQAPKQIDTSKLQKSKLGMATVQRSVSFGGKEFDFKSNLQLFVDPSGKLSTKFGSIGKNEKEIIKEAQDKAFQDYQKTQRGKPYDLDFKVFTKKDLPFGYGGQQTVSDQPTTQLISKEQYFAQQDKPSFLSKIGGLYGKIPSGRFYYNPKISGIGAGVSTFPIGERSIDLTAKVEKGSEKLGEINAKIKKWAFGSQGREKLEKLDLDLETKYQERYQTSFERKYMKGLIYEDKTYEEATKEFETSKEAKILQKEYQEEYGVKYKQISSDVPILRAGAGGLAMAGVSLGQLGLSAIKTPKAAATSTVLVYTGLKTLKAIPTGVSYSASGGLAIYGTYKFVSPTSTIEERGAGLLTAGVSAGFLGYGAYRGLKSPVIKTVKIKPKLSAKINKMVGFEKRPIVKTDVFGETTRIEKTVFPKKSSRQVIEGRKTIVTTKGREIVRKFWINLGVKPKLAKNYLYEGIPTEQLGKTYAATSLRSTTTFKTPSGYQKALKKLTKFGYTKSQARSTLRYISPKVIDTEIKSINVLYSGSAIKTPFAKSGTEVITKQLKIDYGAGLKTRGAKPIKDLYKSEKVIIGSYKDKIVIKEASIRLRSPAALGKATTEYERTILAKAEEIKKTKVDVGIKQDDLLLSEEFEFKSQNLKEVFRQQQVVPKKLRELYGGQKSALIKTTKDPLFIDERELTGIRASKTFVQTEKAAKIKTIEQMSGKELKEMIRDVQKIYGTEKPLPKLKLPKIVNKPAFTFDKVDDAAITRSSDQVSKYSGTGQYERTTGGISPQELKGFDMPQLKTPDVTLKKQIRDISKLDNLLKLNIGSLASVKSLSGLKTKTDLKSDLKLKVDLKNILKSDLALKSKQTPALKQLPSLKTLLKTQLNFKQATPSLLTPAIVFPTIPQITTPPFKPKPFFIPILKAKIKDKRKKKKKKGQEFAFLPDFTARALGLKSETITGKQAQKRVKKILTGLEIRRPVKIK